jgi:hypothetical protein
MALPGPIPVEFGHVFPRGAFAAGGFEPVRDFEASKAGRFVQSKDKASGLPVWVVEVIDADPQARGKTAGADWTVRCFLYPATTPILSIDAGRTAVSVSIADRERMAAGWWRSPGNSAGRPPGSPPTASGCTPPSTTSPP